MNLMTLNETGLEKQLVYNELVDPDVSGYLVPERVAWGEGRKRNLKYYQYTSDSTQILSAKMELNEEIEIPPPVNTFGIKNWKPKFSFSRLWLYTGPGWLMSIAYLDPGNLESDLQAGAVAEYQLIWVLWWATVLGWALQTLSARLGVVTGKNLAQICRYEYNYKTAVFLWIMTQLAIIGSDIQEVVGSSIAYNILFGWPLWAGCLLTALDSFLFLFLNSMGMRVLEAFFCSLIAIMAICFAIEFVIGKPDVSAIFKGWFVPSCSSHAVEQAVGMIGAVIMPHNLFLHSGLVQTRKIKRTSKLAVQDGNYYNTIECAITLFVSFIINLCVVAVFAKGFYGSEGADQIGLKEAGDKLEERFGTLAKYVWAIGLLAAGQSSTMTGTFAGQFSMAGFLDLHWKPWQQALFTRSISLVPALVVALVSSNNFDNVDEWLNVQQSVQLPFALLPLIFLNCNQRVMGDFRLTFKWRIFFYLASALVVSVNVYLIVLQLYAVDLNRSSKLIVVCACLFAYLGMCFYLIFDYVFYSKSLNKKRTLSNIEQTLSSIDY